jgi:hypothetical protein
VKVPDMRFDINMQEDTNGIFAVDEQVETNICQDCSKKMLIDYLRKKIKGQLKRD